LLIEVGRDETGPLYRRAHDFDEKTAEYIIAGEIHDDEAEASAPAPTPRAGKGKAGRAKKSHLRVAASRTSAVAVARTAGG
jgi:hypothetical protein